MNFHIFVHVVAWRKKALAKSSVHLLYYITEDEFPQEKDKSQKNEKVQHADKRKNEIKLKTFTFRIKSTRKRNNFSE
jgi:hypothetical protein